MTSVDICVATYKRPAWLGQLLDDLAAQEMPVGSTLRVVVVDNDPERAAEPVARGFESTRVALLYLTQPVKNIALTRNVALDHCKAEWVAFVDDDERVPRSWICTLMACQQRFDADVVFGPVEGQFPEGAPDWVRQGRFFASPKQATGSLMPWGATNNALLRGSLVYSGARFDARFGLTGGEDTHFFHGLARAGKRLVWCSEAGVTERVPANRTTLRWLLSRHFRGGQCFADIVSRPPGGLALAGWVLQRGAYALTAAALAVLSLPLTRGRAVRGAAKMATNIGQLSTIFSRRFQEYR